MCYLLTALCSLACQNRFCPLLKRGLLSSRENSFLLKNTPFQKVLDVQETKQEVTKIASLVKKIKVLQALHHVQPLHLHQASAITLSKIKSKGRCISLSLNSISTDACTGVNFGYVQCSKSNHSKRRQTRVTVHVFCKSPHSAFTFV